MAAQRAKKRVLATVTNAMRAPVGAWLEAPLVVAASFGQVAASVTKAGTEADDGEGTTVSGWRAAMTAGVVSGRAVACSATSATDSKVTTCDSVALGMAAEREAVWPT
jgi:hypothetical protein